MNILKLIFFTFLTFLLISCNNEPKFDLLDISFDKDDVFTLVEEEKHAVYPGYISTGSEKILNLSGLDLTKKFSNQAQDNFIALYYTQDTNKIYYYSVHINHKEMGQALLKTLKEKFGEADYFGYKGSGKEIVDFKKEVPYKYIWEDKTNNRLFIFSLDGENNSEFRAMINHKKSEDILGMARAGYWNDFVDKRIKINNPDYTYNQFIKDELKDVFPSILTKLSHGKIEK
ncbi:MAG: hypothetical protein KAG56_10655 [Sulfurovaceae bacterium]|nr:hypothetical protein [Sulfurovaceae bacterium]